MGDRTNRDSAAREPVFRRRDVLRLAALSPLASIVGSGCSDDGGGVDASLAATAFGPFPCRPTSTSMALWAEESDGPLPQAVVFGPDDSPIYAEFASIGDGLAIATLEGLVPDTEYRFEVSGRPKGSFRTMPPSDGLVRLAFGADIHGDSKPYTAFGWIVEERPHLYVGLGDQVYADLGPGGPVGTTVEDYVALYRATWADRHLLEAFANVPTSLVWDDHEVWNDYDGSFGAERIDAAKYTYEHFQHSRSNTTTAWSVIDAGPASIFVLDTRSFRSPNLAFDDASKSMLGAAQKQALTEWLGSSTAALRIVASPTAFHAYSDTGPDSFAGGFVTELTELMDLFAASSPASLVLVSGDLHWPSVVRHVLPGGAELMEFGCTPTAAFPRTGPASVGPDVLYVEDGVRGFGSIRFDGSTGSLDFRFIDERGVERFRYAR